MRAILGTKPGIAGFLVTAEWTCDIHDWSIFHYSITHRLATTAGQPVCLRDTRIETSKIVARRNRTFVTRFVRTQEEDMYGNANGQIPKPTRITPPNRTTGNIADRCTRPVTIAKKPLHLMTDAMVYAELVEARASGDAKAIHAVKTEIITRSQGDIARTIYTFCRNVPRNSLCTPEDLIGEANLRAWKRLDDFDPTKGLTFMQFMNSSGNRSQIVGAAVDGLRSLANLPREIPRKKRVLHVFCTRASTKYGYNVSSGNAHEIASELRESHPVFSGISKAEVLEAASDPLTKTSVFTQSANANDDEEDSDIASRYSGYAVQPREQGDNFDEVLDWITDPLQRQCMDLYYRRSIGLKDIAEKLKLPKAVIADAIEKAKLVIRVWLTHGDYIEEFMRDNE